ncbi:virion core protein, T7 gp14 family [Bacterioplanoides sp.]|uniref:virion core protein, T7 gp14 family n=1 Tax=Bacterioplanoides sp. TaxID=2066072 RepID=UPI003AFFF986
MCDPVTIGITMAGVSAGMSYQQSVRQHEAAEQAYEQNRTDALAQERDQLRVIQQNLDAEEAANNAEQRANGLETLRATASAITTADSQNAAGNTVSALVQDIQRQNAARSLNITRNADYAYINANNEANSAHLNRQSRINSVARPRFDRGMALLGAGVSGAQTGASAYSATSSASTSPTQG